MHRNPLLDALERYKKSPLIHTEEHIDAVIDFITKTPRCFDRNNPGHVTASAWILSHDQKNVLLTHHKKLNIWIQLGGHTDNNPDVPAVALQEAYEESGIEHLELVSSDIYDIDIHPLSHACTYHYDIRYLIKASPNSAVKVSDESHNLAWVPLAQLRSYTTDSSVLRMAAKTVHLYASVGN